MSALATTAADIGRTLSVMDLEQRLADAELGIIRADYCENTEYREREKAFYRKRVAELKALIEEKRRAA